MQQQKSDYIEEPICTVNGETVVKRYRKLRAVGEGSYSKCWLVQTEGSNSSYVVKVIPKKKLELLMKEKLVYEIRIHQQLSHPNVVHLDHWFEDASHQYIFLEYCSEGNLEKRLSSRSKMSEKDIRYYARQVVEALIYIHSKNILHRDLKLCNFYLDSNDQLKLGDFGFACQLAYPNQLKRETCGTPNYIAPEAVSGFGYSFSSDVWGVGVVLYRLKYKLCPFQGRSVRQTLQKVKTCQYVFPKGQKISQQLKDLIEKIFVINYDDRLTLEQIITHPFFMIDHQTSQIKPSRSEVKSFSLIRNIFSKEKDRRQEKPKKEKEEAKRSNSCETFKQIKEIFKNKSKGTLMTSLGTQLRTEENISHSTVTQSNRERSSIGGTSLRSVAETSFGSSHLNTKRIQGTSRVNNFLGNMKQQMKLHNKLPPPAQKSSGNLSIQLGLIAKKHYLPYQVQIQKDVTIVHYKDSVKQLFYSGNSYIMHRDSHQLYDMTGNLYSNPPKMLRYIIENKVSISENEPEQEEYGINTIEKILLFVSHKSIMIKDGIILRYGGGSSGVFVAKMTSQQLFYIGSLLKENDQLKEDGKGSLMYLRQGKNYKCAQGVVLSRIYQGWIANAFKHSKE